jgi:hypothetical protein
MATFVNPQITDAVTQNNVKLVGESPAHALGVALQALAQATSLAMENATGAQGSMQQIAGSATGSICAMITRLGAQG